MNTVNQQNLPNIDSSAWVKNDAIKGQFEQSAEAAAAQTPADLTAQDGMLSNASTPTEQNNVAETTSSSDPATAQSDSVSQVVPGGKLRDLFNKYAGGDNLINGEELRRTGINNSGNALWGENSDFDNDGYLNFEEFAHRVKTWADGREPTIEGNRNGVLDEIELQNTIDMAKSREAQGFGTTTYEQDLNHPKLDKGMKPYDVNGSGTISLDEVEILLNAAARDSSQYKYANDKNGLDRDEWNRFAKQTGYKGSEYSDETWGKKDFGLTDFVDNRSFAQKIMGDRKELSMQEFFELFPNLRPKLPVPHDPARKE
jgi:hypothetical protein